MMFIAIAIIYIQHTSLQANMGNMIGRIRIIMRDMKYLLRCLQLSIIAISIIMMQRRIRSRLYTLILIVMRRVTVMGLNQCRIAPLQRRLVMYVRTLGSEASAKEQEFAKRRMPRYCVRVKMIAQKTKKQKRMIHVIKSEIKSFII